MLDTHKRLIRHRLAIRKRQRERLHGAVDGPPDVDDAVAPLQQGSGFGGGEVLLDTDAGGSGGLVDVDAPDGGAGGVGGGAADGVVEEDDALGVGDVREEKRFDFGVVVLLDGGVGEEVMFRGGGNVG